MAKAQPVRKKRVKGRFAHAFARSRDRLTSPLIRRDGRLQPATWEEALDLVGRELRRTSAQHGPDSVAAISSARATNEENYLLQKLMRTVIGTNNVDNCSRLCHAPSAAGLVAAFGLSGGMNSFHDLDRTDCILLVGANPTSASCVPTRSALTASFSRRPVSGTSSVAPLSRCSTPCYEWHHPGGCAHSPGGPGRPSSPMSAQTSSSGWPSFATFSTTN